MKYRYLVVCEAEVFVAETDVCGCGDSFHSTFSPARSALPLLSFYGALCPQHNYYYTHILRSLPPGMCSMMWGKHVSFPFLWQTRRLPDLELGPQCYKISRFWWNISNLARDKTISEEYQYTMKNLGKSYGPVCSTWIEQALSANSNFSTRAVIKFRLIEVRLG